MNKKKLYNTRGCADTQHNDVVQNYNLTNNNYIKEKIKEYLNAYTQHLTLSQSPEVNGDGIKEKKE